MPSKSPAQHKLMTAVAHNPAFAKKVNIPQKVGKEFARADKRMADGGGVKQPNLIKDLQAYAAKISRPGPGRAALMAKDKAASQKRLKEDTAGLSGLEKQHQAMKAKYESLGGSGYKMADREQNLSPAEREARGMETEMGRLSSRIQAAKKSTPSTYSKGGKAKSCW
jgi:hypothetical protein